ncbi:class I SAM-dependent methyltransferase [Seleniivibrio woodruffii]|uniref:Methyltransferase family protein n=1 Tax=Seleniivibrio woodruffii TaxID=1078050 RepID=A0A4R1KCH1_9BACT|nr:class I SAM-dependent methyltransferase [Seleniivibrio woodruffii]TCK61663.1 methyltransferase family protein [Seleniivibrio woodruffii]TVZ35222.1 methyltransferase family protein [Seleniivibrio woodruffii]
MGYKQEQFNEYTQMLEESGYVTLGVLSSATWNYDPKRLTFCLSRYKFAAKMLSGKDTVLEVGAGDCFASRIVSCEVNKLICTDYDEKLISEAEKMRRNDMANTEFKVHDMLTGAYCEQVDAIYCLDVFEHIAKQDERIFLENIKKSLNEHGIFLVGMPSLESQQYASEGSKAGHVNCKNGNEMKKLLEEYYHNCFLFSMNDEVVHTGFSPMAHYIIAVCTGKKQ